MLFYFILLTGAKHNYILFINQFYDLYQIEASFVFEQKNRTLNIILQVSFVKPEYILTLHQYLPFPLSQYFSNNHLLTPTVLGEKDILAFGFMNTFKILSQSDLAGCHHMGEHYFCKGRNVLQTVMENTCLGSILLDIYQE